MTFGQYENNILSILTFAATRSTWVSVSSCASKSGVDYDTTYRYLERDEFGQIAHFYRYEYAVRRRHGGYYLSAVLRGYA